MESIVNVPRNRGVLPRDPEDREELQITDETVIPEDYDQRPEISAGETDKPEEAPVYTHVRAPELRRAGTRILMGLTAVCGAVSGAVIAFSDSADPAALQALSKSLSGEFREIFGHSEIIGMAFLAAELLLGFFAFGDWLVWILPLCYAMGAALRVAASGTGVLLPSAAAGVCAVTFAAATSAAFSQTLLRLSKGGTVYQDRSPRRDYALAFLGYALILTAAAVYEGIALNRV